MEIIHKFTDVELILHAKNFTQYLEKLKLNNVPNMKDNKSMLNPLKMCLSKIIADHLNDISKSLPKFTNIIRFFAIKTLEL